MRVAIVHDWLVTWAGAEKVLEVLLSLFPDAELFTMVNFLEVEAAPILRGRRIHTSFIQNLPGAKSNYRKYLPLMPIAVEQFDLKGFDLIVSSSHAVAKGVIPDPEAVHVCYCYSPMRYAWDMQNQYLKQTGNASGLKSIMMRWVLHRLRLWDFASAQRVDHFVAISEYIKRRINSVYRRDSLVVYPPVDCRKFDYKKTRKKFYVTAGRMVPYKRFDIVVEAFTKLRHLELIVIGDGPDFKSIKSMAGDNVHFLGYQSDQVLAGYLEHAAAFVFMAEEDFGILPVEAQSAGAPVIGYGKGGMAETVIHGKTGILVSDQSVDSLVKAIREFENERKGNETAFCAIDCHENALRFSRERFCSELEFLFDTVAKSS
ncbi:glycosyltransferase [Modicisalibacter tunisiensis]|uniref:Glycosyltransferase n=1 Tax=Modicisalibacter tunisiensis TaxID=390637 RepID=A0ABS7WU46_9GAMM|nr:glycosyltransferase [Modicisalibacter tunisiensis]